MKSTMKAALKAAFAMSALLFFMGTYAEARTCTKGKPCGNSCISMNDVCHKTTTSSRMSETTSGTTTSAQSAPAVTSTQNSKATTTTKHCKKGKACGNTCIPMDAVCHQ